MFQREAASHLGLSEEAFRVAYHRFRMRLAQYLWDEVAKLVVLTRPEIPAEIYLIFTFGESAVKSVWIQPSAESCRR